MPISFRHKFKFIHIPKTGGSSIEKVFHLQSAENLFFPRLTKCIAGCWFAPQHFTQRMEDFHKLNMRLGVTKNLTHNNRSAIDKNSIVDGLSIQARNIIYSYFKKDFESFGYAF